MYLKVARVTGAGGDNPSGSASPDRSDQDIFGAELLADAVNSLDDLLKKVRSAPDIKISCDALDKGIDNYHVDVELSESFTFCIKETIDQNMKRLVAGKALLSGNSEPMVEVRSAYADLMRVTMHRSKTDLTTAQIHVLQFALVKFVIQEVRDALDRYSAQLEETLGQQQYAGSRSLLATQERVTWFRKHSNEFMFRMTRLYLRQLQREDNNQLKALREQILGDFPQATNVMFNPLLYARSPKEAILLVDYYAYWHGAGLDFEKLNDAFEDLFEQHLPRLKFLPLKMHQKLAGNEAEVYDELGGLFAAQSFLGPSEDQKTSLHESFSWLEHPGNLRLLFDEKQHAELLKQEGLGLTGGWSLKGDIKKLHKLAGELKKAIGDNRRQRQVLASYALREKLSQVDLGLIDVDEAIGVVSGNENRKIPAIVDLTQEGAAVLQAKLEECVKDFDRMNSEMADELVVRLLTDYSRYRMHLRYYRLAHRIFNRINVITEPEKIQLAKAGGSLYRLLNNDEIKDANDVDGPEIVHHAILKADVRGSTTVTTELTKQGLNPASYFSLRFFNPITEKLSTYGGVKVFIEGDAVILGVYEHDNTPDEWFSVSRACGIGKEILDIVTSKNAHSRQTGLPMLEVGIGICYADNRPMFLFDENRPIMISSAIGDADRMSSCSWRLRTAFDPGNFNVGVMQMADDDSQKGEKGQDLIRYNVNGILIDLAAFEKLQTEVHFKRLKARSGEVEQVFFVGQYPDVMGKERDIVVREGRVGVWRNEQLDLDSDTGLVYHEVLPNSKFAAQIVELARKK